MEEVRISKYFTDCGVMSRRAAEEEIKKGRVLVNGKVAELGQKIIPESDKITYNGHEIKPREFGSVCIMLNKPRGVVCTASDEKDRIAVTELCRNVIGADGKPLRLYPIGRLDMDSDGLLLLTNDGELANILTHPKHKIPKTYRVLIAGNIPEDGLSDEEIHDLGKPISIDGRRTAPVRVTRMTGKHPKFTALLRFELYEGRNRQIRRMCEAQGYRVKQLTRISIGDLKLGELELGKWRYLSEKEVAYLKGTI